MFELILMHEATCAIHANSRERDFYAPQWLQFHHDAVAGLEPDRLDQAAGQHDFAGAQALAVGCEMVGEPGECVVRVAEYIRAGPLPGLDAIDDGPAGHSQQVWRGGSRYGVAEHATGGKEIIRNQRRSTERLPLLITIIDDLDRRQISVYGVRNVLCREWRVGRRKIAPEPNGYFAFDADADEITRAK